METFLIIWLSFGLLYMAYSTYALGYYSLQLIPLTLLGIALGPISVFIGEYQQMWVMRAKWNIVEWLTRIVDAKVFWNKTKKR